MGRIDECGASLLWGDGVVFRLERYDERPMKSMKLIVRPLDADQKGRHVLDVVRSNVSASALYINMEWSNCNRFVHAIQNALPR